MIKISEIFNGAQNNYFYQYLLGCMYTFPVFCKDNENNIIRGLNQSIYLTISYKVNANIRLTNKYRELSGDDFNDTQIRDFENMVFNKVKELVTEDSIVRNSNLSNMSRRIYDGISIEVVDDLGISSKSPAEFLGHIEKIILELDENGKNGILLGIFDSRGSLDFALKFMSLDLIGGVYNEPDEDEAVLVSQKRRFIYQLSDGMLNYNPRILQPHAFNKNDQLRMKLSDYIFYYGLFTPFKIYYYLLETESILDFSNPTLMAGVYKNTDVTPKEKFSRILNAGFINDDVSAFEIELNRRDISGDERERLIELFRIEKFETDSDEKGSSAQIKYYAKELAGFKCELDHSHESFTARSNNKQYVEAHHFIPYSKKNNFDINIDVPENMVSLCPNCHKKIHNGLRNEVDEMLDTLIDLKIEGLKSLGFNLSKDEIACYY